MVSSGESGSSEPAPGGLIEKGILVLVDWKDAMGGTRSGWRPIDTMHAPTADCQSVGWVVENTAEKIVVVPHKAGDEGDGEIAIPKDWVQKITPLTMKRGKRV